MDDVRGITAVQDHVHDRDDVDKRLLLLASERTFVESFEFLCGEPGNAILLNGDLQTANREIGVPGIQSLKRFA